MTGFYVSGDKIDVVCIFQNESIISEWLKGISTKQSHQKTPNGFAISNAGLAIGDFTLTRNQMLKNRKNNLWLRANDTIGKPRLLWPQAKNGYGYRDIGFHVFFFFLYWVILVVGIYVFGIYWR